MILIKLGGSIITYKNKKERANTDSLKKIATCLKRIKEPLLLVHGGGSFGHYWSVVYDIHTKPAVYDPKGVSIVKESMINLNRIVLNTLMTKRLYPFPVPPLFYVDSDGKPDQKRISNMKNMIESGLIPVTYGDILWYKKSKSYILSGDKIMGILSKAMKPRMAVFVTNVDGIYSDIKGGKKVVAEVTSQDRSFKQLQQVQNDVTGGMKRKVSEAVKISKMGTKTFFVNGNKPTRILNAIQGKKFEGTLFRR